MKQFLSKMMNFLPRQQHSVGPHLVHVESTRPHVVVWVVKQVLMENKI